MSTEMLEVLQTFQYILAGVGLLCMVLSYVSVPSQNAAPFAGLAALVFAVNAILFVLTKDTGEAVVIGIVAAYAAYTTIEVGYLES